MPLVKKKKRKKKKKGLVITRTNVLLVCIHKCSQAKQKHEVLAKLGEFFSHTNKFIVKLLETIENIDLPLLNNLLTTWMSY